MFKRIIYLVTCVLFITIGVVCIYSYRQSFMSFDRSQITPVRAVVQQVDTLTSSKLLRISSTEDNLSGVFNVDLGSNNNYREGSRLTAYEYDNHLYLSEVMVVTQEANVFLLLCGVVLVGLGLFLWVASYF